MPHRRVVNWLKKFEKYFFAYKDGYFVLPYLVNTPELMIESLSKMPFVNHSPENFSLISSSPFMKGEMKYKEIEKGLWLLVTDSEFKVNIHSQSVYDKLGSDYYFLAFSIYKNKNMPEKDMQINKTPVKNNSWVVYRPGVPIEAFHNRGTRGLFFNFSFSKAWIMANLSDGKTGTKDLLQKISDEDPGYLIWDRFSGDYEKLALEIWQCLKEDSQKGLSSIKIKFKTLEIITQFFLNANDWTDSKVALNKNFRSLSAVSKTEEYLMLNLTSDFPGIEFLSERVNVSASKLKVEFKKNYGVSVYQYFRNRQMYKAMEMLKGGMVQIKNVAVFFGYENASKFSAAFKKVHGVLPSEISKL